MESTHIYLFAQLCLPFTPHLNIRPPHINSTPDT